MNRTAKRPATKATGKSKTILSDYAVRTFEGLNTYIKDLRQLSDGESPNSLNWITGRYGDNIALRAGYQLLGITRVAGVGRVSGLGVGTNNTGAQIPFFVYGNTLKYYNATTGDTVTVGTLAAGGAGDDFSVIPYKNIAGSFVYVCSPNSSMYKIAVANPGSFVDLGPTDYKGHVKAGTNRMFLWNRVDLLGQKYNSTIYNSVPDKTSLSQFGQTTADNVGTGNGSSKTFTGTLSLSQATAFNTEFSGPIQAGNSVTAIQTGTTTLVTANNNYSVGDAVYLSGIGGMTQINGIVSKVVVAGPSAFSLDINSTTFSAFTSGGNSFKCEYFIDDQNGNLVSNLGGTGTVNYATGAFVLNFNTAPINSGVIYAQYYAEVITGSIVDFVSNGAASFTQFDGGGDIQNLYSFDQVEYCMHLLTSWYLNVANSATAFNLPYRNRLGTPYLRAGFATEDGVVYLDGSIPSQPKVQILQIDANSSTAVVTVVPTSISDQLDLTQFGFSQAVIFRWNEWDILACAPSQNGVVQALNASLFMRNIYSGKWDAFDIPASCFDEFNGMLISGDSLSNNVFQLFTGYTDDGANINNFWQGKMYDLGVPGLKKFNRFVIKGLIQQDQSLNVGFSFDSGNFTTFFTVQGNASYVNLGSSVTVGSSPTGFNVVGGGGDVITAYPFEVEFIVNADVFEYVQPQFQATGIGFVQIDEFTFKDVRYKSRRVLPSRTANPD